MAQKIKLKVAPKKVAVEEGLLVRRNIWMGREWDQAQQWAGETTLGSAARFVRACVIEHGPKVLKKYRKLF